VAAAAPGGGSTALAWLGASSIPIASDDVRRLRSASLSPDGTKVAGVALEGGRADVWVADISRGSSTRLTHSGINVSPVWSADGRTVFFASRTNGAYEIWSRDADGAQPAARRLSNAGNPRHALPLAASADGRTLAFVQTAPGRRADIWALPLDGGEPRAPRAIVQGPFDDVAAAFSPDSSMMAFQSADAGRWEISVVRLADGKRVVVSTDGGERPFWRAGGLVFESHGRLVRTSVSGDLRVEPLSRVADLAGATLRGVSPDGRYLVNRADAAPSSLTVSLDWIREARTLIGPPSTALPR
jgi:Tol biopolymer transport system component